jgi:hypothetical protein
MAVQVIQPAPPFLSPKDKDLDPGLDLDWDKDLDPEVFPSDVVAGSVWVGLSVLVSPLVSEHRLLSPACEWDRYAALSDE